LVTICPQLEPFSRDCVGLCVPSWIVCKRPRTVAAIEISTNSPGGLVMPIVLVSNEANANDKFNWQDITGVQYHYPNGYRNLVRPGERFIYYPGMRRADGRRAPAEYFGCGTIGDIRRDASIPETAPKGRWAWYCTILDYLPFSPAVPAKINEEFFETIPSNAWRNGVRALDEATYQQIVAAAGLQIEPPTRPVPTAPPQMPMLEEVTIPAATTDDLLVPNAPSTGADYGRSTHNNSGRRYSRHSTIIGKRAEEIALAWVKQALPLAREVRWVSDQGETPGWDIEVTDEHGTVLALEVKGASGRAFLNFELTPGELKASQQLGSRYWLLLVADCLGQSPRLQVVKDPYAMITSGHLKIVPSGYCVSARAQSGKVVAEEAPNCTDLPIA
jgi:hypothetical protein